MNDFYFWLFRSLPLKVVPNEANKARGFARAQSSEGDLLFKTIIVDNEIIRVIRISKQLRSARWAAQ